MNEIRVVVLAKQVPDTRNVGKDAMKADGTVNRGALPAVFNPEDMNALELALSLKDTHPNIRVTLLTMGPPRAVEILKEGLYRGADDGVLLTDRAFAGSDTLATSYALASAVRKLSPHMVIAGRQAIDGDTAQVGPQVAEKLGWPQVTYVEDVVDYRGDSIVLRRRLERGVEVVQSPTPLVITVNSSAAPCRSRHAKLVMQWKNAQVSSACTGAGCVIGPLEEWSADSLGADPAQLGLNGSPTKVKSVENVVFQVKEAKRFDSSRESIELLVQELLSSHTLG